ncbi:MAG: aldo/keto reductase, partial [Parcubacteria group bacterium]|nr:aldo/keto reductase [Parcubacteria group bacterium]
MKTLTFKNGQTIPALGLGTWKLKGDECVRAVSAALEIGYTHIDTADAYDNHHEVGKAIKASGIPRDALFVTSKIWPDEQQKSAVIPACERILSELGLEYLDLLLMHWPDRSIPFADTLGEMEKLRAQGLIRSNGVSNFTVHHLQDALETGKEFVANQVEFHPTLNQKELKAFCDEHQILMTAYSPLARGKDLDLPAIIELAEKYEKTPAQIIINWVLAKGMAAIPKSATPRRIKENWEAQNFELSEEDVAKIDAIGGANRVVDGTV